MDKIGTGPIRADEIFEFALNALREKGALENLPEETYRKQADELKKLFPDHFFPDVYLDLPLMGGEFQGLAAVLDCYERCYLDYTTDGEYFRSIGIPALNAPENRDDLLVLFGKGSEPVYKTINRRFAEIQDLAKPEFQDAHLSGFSALEQLSELPTQFLLRSGEDCSNLLFTIGPQNARKRYIQRPYKKKLQKILTDAGCEEASVLNLDNASFNCGVPYLHPQEGYMEWVACMDVAAFSLTVQKGVITDCHAIIRISEKSLTYARTAIRRTQAYQWHITDHCDQRCKHCYLFAEDARMKCVTTPWDQLMLTMDEITEDAALRCGYPMPAVSGGDPILHPDFWKFAEELHKRGIQWMIMGNPFHLNEEVCKRLYQLGCFKYQQSLDGLEEFHDYMRKPGSYKATLDAVKLLNDAGIQSQLMATASKQNLEDILACMEIAVEHKVTDFTFARYCATSPEKAEESYPSPEEYRSFLLRYYNKSKEYEANHCKTGFKFKEHLFTLLEYELGKFEPSEYSKQHPELIFEGCHLGQGCTILANGDLMACRRMESVIGNVKTGKIHDILSSELCMKYMAISEIKKCKDCELLQWCRGCRAVGFNATRDLQCEDPCCWKK